MTHLSTEYVKRPDLQYPFGLRWSPAEGEPFEVVDGVYWLRMPLPMDLDHINLWLLRDGDGWTIVDSGMGTDICRAVWEQVFDTFLDPTTVKRIIVTHLHPDHIGLAAWLALRCECPVLISKGEFEAYNKTTHRDNTTFAQESHAFFAEMGYSRDVAAKFVSLMSSDKPLESRVQTSMCQFIADGDIISIDGRAWQVVSGNGHSPEHSCLYNAELNVFISGDQSIPRISSNVSVYSSNRRKNPLKDWLNSCAKLRDLIPNDTLILPSHQEPFCNNKVRMQELIDNHHADLNRLRLAIDSPVSVIEARAVMFARELNMMDTLLASGETLAHLNYLVHAGEISMTHDQQGVARYCKQ